MTTTDERDADIALVLDTGANIGDPRTPSGTSLDLAVRAAASVAEYYLRQGDRVGLIDLSQGLHSVRLAAGERHLHSIMGTLLNTQVRSVDRGAERRAIAGVPPNALVMVFSPLVDVNVGRHIATLAQRGHVVLIIDTMPADVVVRSRSPWASIAWRIWSVERDTLIQVLAERGVPVVKWHGPSTLDQVLVRLRVAAQARRSRR